MTTTKERKIITSKYVWIGISILIITATLGACSSGGGGGGSSAANVPRFAYVANLFDNIVSIYTINPATGALARNGADVTAGSGPAFITTTGSIQ